MGLLVLHMMVLFPPKLDFFVAFIPSGAGIQHFVTWFYFPTGQSILMEFQTIFEVHVKEYNTVRADLSVNKPYLEVYTIRAHIFAR